MEDLLFTGSSGFLGKNIYPLLLKNYNIATCGTSCQNQIQVNLAKEEPLIKKHFSIVLHAGGKAHIIPKNEVEEQAFFDVNYIGTRNLCTALERSGIPESFIFISTVAVYGCESGKLITEDHPLNGDTPYAKSKIMAEEYLQEWCSKFGVKLGIIRPSLIAGPNPPGNLGAMIRGIDTGRYLSIGEGKARKSVLMVQDIANLVPKLEKKGGIYNVCDDYNPSFRELETLIASQLGKKQPASIPYFLAKGMALVGDYLGRNVPINSLKLKKITESLTFSNEKAKKELSWQPLSVLECFKIK